MANKTNPPIVFALLFAFAGCAVAPDSADQSASQKGFSNGAPSMDGPSADGSAFDGLIHEQRKESEFSSFGECIEGEDPVCGSGLCGIPAGQCCRTTCEEECSEEREPHPGDPDGFLCPIQAMVYCDSFDCDDFAYACKKWSDAQGVNACQLTYRFRDDDGWGWSSHAINIVEFETDLPGRQKWCLIEPQSNNSYCCWDQPAGEEPEPPQACLNQACGPFLWEGSEHSCYVGEDNCQILEVWCDNTHSCTAGEPCFTTDQETCQLFDELTGCGYLFEGG